jgi:hypothetical protein
VYAHSGVLAAAGVIWEDMECHGILQVLLSNDANLHAPSDRDVQQLPGDRNGRGKAAAEIARLGLRRQAASTKLWALNPKP